MSDSTRAEVAVPSGTVKQQRVAVAAGDQVGWHIAERDGHSIDFSAMFVRGETVLGVLGVDRKVPWVQWIYIMILQHRARIPRHTLVPPRVVIAAAFARRGTAGRNVTPARFAAACPAGRKCAGVIVRDCQASAAPERPVRWRPRSERRYGSCSRLPASLLLLLLLLLRRQPSRLRLFGGNASLRFFNGDTSRLGLLRSNASLLLLG